MKTTVLLASLGLMACGKAAPSHTNAIFGTLDLTLMSEGAARCEAPALGSLMVQLPDPETPGKTFALPQCTGIQIGPRQVLTAGHCDRAGFVFSKNRIALPGDTGKVEVSTLGPDLRLQFTGDLIPAEQADESQPPAGLAIYKDTALDAAVLEFAYDLPASWIDLSSVSDDTSKLAHFGYPNGLPIAVSKACHGDSPTGDAHFRHDCDSMTGSSGGLLVNPETRAAVGMQLAAPGYNLSAYYLQNGHFESPEDFAVRRGCATGDAECIRTKGLNDAVKLSAVAASIQKASPELWSRLY